MRNAALRVLLPVTELPRSGARFAARSFQFFPRGLQPLSLAGTSRGSVLTVLCSFAVLVVAGAETVRPGLASLGSLLFLPVLVAAWLVGLKQAIAVSALAVATRMFGHSISGVDFGTALSEATMIAALAVTARLAASSIVETQKADARVRRQAYSLRLLEQREQIAAEVNDAALRKLFGLSISLQALSEFLEDDDLKQRVARLVSEIDGLCVELRGLVFNGATDSDLASLA